LPAHGCATSARSDPFGSIKNASRCIDHWAVFSRLIALNG
jgi:hypothetical protein